MEGDVSKDDEIISHKTIDKHEINRKKPPLGDDEISEIVSNFEHILGEIDSQWFLPEETRKLRTQYLYVTFFICLFYTVRIEDITKFAFVGGEIKIIHRYILDTFLLFVSIGLGTQYIIAAYTELAERNYLWKIKTELLNVLATNLSLISNRNKVKKSIKNFNKMGKLTEQQKDRVLRLKIRKKQKFLAKTIVGYMEGYQRHGKWARNFGLTMPVIVFSATISAVVLAYALRFNAVQNLFQSVFHI